MYSSLKLLIVHTLAIRQECSWHAAAPALHHHHHHHQNAEGSNIFEKNALGRVGILILDGGQLFQRVLRESVKNFRIVEGGVGVKIFKTVGMF